MTVTEAPMIVIAERPGLCGWCGGLYEKGEKVIVLDGLVHKRCAVEPAKGRVRT